MFLTLAGAALALAACGDDAGGAGQAAEAGRARAAALEFARCMRANGVDMPDPRSGESGELIVGGPPGDADAAQEPPAKMEAAHKACQKHLADLEPPEMSPEKAREFKARALEHARCMRENGVDFPDPQFGEGGEARIEIGPGNGSGVDPRSPAFQAAQEQCEKLLGGGPGGGGVARAGGGS